MINKLKILGKRIVRSVRPESRGVVDYYGVKIPLGMPILSDKIVSSIRDGSYEYDESRQIAKIIQPGERVLELGVGIGFVSTLILNNDNVEDYIGYEANPELVPYIEEIFQLNNVAGKIRNAVLGHHWQTDEVEFFLRKNFWASSLSPKPWGYKSSVKVPAKDLNGVIEEFQPTLIVCDIEGGELDLFRHANLLGVNKVYMEIHQKVLGRTGIKELFDIMSAKGFHYDQWHSSGAVVLFSDVERGD